MTMCRSSSVSTKRALCALLFIALVSFAQAVGMRSQGSASGSAMSDLDATPDKCAEPFRSGSCMVSVTCNVCLMRPGCAIEATTGNCVSMSRINATIGAEYIKAEENKYCSASDDACTVCSSNNAAPNAVCRGKDGCVCTRQCELATPVFLSCSSGSGFNMLYFVIIASIIFPAMLFVAIKKSLFANLATDMGRLRRRVARSANPLALKLDGWRSQMEKEHHDRPTKFELARCSLHRDSDSIEEGRRTEDCDVLSPSSSIDFMAASTPKSIDDSRATSV